MSVSVFRFRNMFMKSTVVGVVSIMIVDWLFLMPSFEEI